MVHFGGRFELSLQVPVRVDYKTNKVTLAGSPTFWLHAVSRVEQLTDGRQVADYDGALQREFHEDKWDELVSSEFDLSVIGIPVAEVREVKGFKAYTATVRQPLLRVPK